MYQSAMKCGEDFAAAVPNGLSKYLVRRQLVTIGNEMRLVIMKKDFSAAVPIGAPNKLAAAAGADRQLAIGNRQ